MADQRSRLTMELLMRVRGTGDVDRLARAVDDTGDEMSEAARDAKLLDAAIDDVTDELRRLNRELLATGDIEALDKSKGARSTLAMLKRMRRELGDVEKDAGRAGRSIGDVLGALPSQLKGGAIIAAAGAAAAVAPLIAGAVSAAVIGGVGAGGIVGGIVAASRDSRVQAAAQDMVGQLEREFFSLGPLFAEPVINSIGILGDAATGLLRDLRPQLAALGPVTEQLAAGVAGLIREAGPGIAVALREAVPVLEALARELPGLGRDLRETFGLIAGGGEDAADALGLVVDMLGVMLKASASAIRGFTELFGLIRDIDNLPVIRQFKDFTQGLTGAEQETRRLKVATSDLAGEYTGDLDPALGDTAQTMEEQRAAAVRSADSLDEAAEAAGGLSEALRILNGGVLNVRDAEREFQAAIDGVTESIEENGKTLDINTEKGRNNQAALDEIAESAIQLADATLEQTGNQHRANEVLQEGREALINAGIQMGLTRKEAKDLADELLRIPRRKTIQFSTEGLSKAQKAAGDFKALIDGIDRFVVVNVGVTGTGSNQPLAPGMFAEGGLVRKGELAVVGERGPELVAFRENARVFSNADSRRMVNAVGTTGVGRDGAAMPEEFVATAVIDLGDGITKRVEMLMRRKDRTLKRRAMAGVGSVR